MNILHSRPFCTTHTKPNDIFPLHDSANRKRPRNCYSNYQPIQPSDSQLESLAVCQHLNHINRDLWPYMTCDPTPPTPPPITTPWLLVSSWLRLSNLISDLSWLFIICICPHHCLGMQRQHKLIRPLAPPPPHHARDVGVESNICGYDRFDPVQKLFQITGKQIQSVLHSLLHDHCWQC